MESRQIDKRTGGREGARFSSKEGISFSLSLLYDIKEMWPAAGVLVMMFLYQQCSGYKRNIEFKKTLGGPNKKRQQTPNSKKQQEKESNAGCLFSSLLLFGAHEMLCVEVSQLKGGGEAGGGEIGRPPFTEGGATVQTGLFLFGAESHYFAGVGRQDDINFMNFL